MGLGEYLGPDAIEIGIHSRCKREALAHIAEKAAELTGSAVSDIEQALMDREELGSTGVGHGVAIPHGKVENLSEVFAMCVLLDQPLEFDAVDDAPVDILFVLLAPKNASAAHLKALAKATRLLRDEKVRAALRGAETTEAIHAILTDTTASNAA
ncbi:MAG: PTS sugar transporter subunit IIA [Pseudomonadota bacterium]